MFKSRLFTIFMVAFIGLTGFSFFIPLLPSFAAEFGADEGMQGLLIASYAVAQFIGAPILGRLSDRYGRRPVLIISTLGTFLSLLLLAFANSLWLLFASRLLDGLTGGNISVAQAYMTDITDEKSRAKGLGLLGAAFGLGFIVGPAMGGILSAIGADVLNPMVVTTESSILAAFDWTYALPAFGATLIALLNLIQVFYLPESLSAEKRRMTTSQPTGYLSVGRMMRLMGEPVIGPLLNTRLFFGLAFSMFQTVFPIYAALKLGLNPAAIALVLAFAGILIVFTQGFAIGRLTARVEDRHLLFVASCLMTIGLAGWALVGTVPALLLVLIPIAFSGGVFNTIINSALTKASVPEQFGVVLGVSTSLESLTRIVAPILGGWLIAQAGPSAPGVLCAVVLGLTVAYMWARILPQSVGYHTS